MTDLGTHMTKGKEESGLCQHQLQQNCVFDVELNKPEKRETFDSEAHRRFMRSLG